MRTKRSRGARGIVLDWYGAPMRIGAHVRAGRGIQSALERGGEIGAEVVQIFTQSPRIWKPSPYRPTVLADYRRAQRENPTVVATFCHATYLINLGSPDPELAAKSRSCLKANLRAARGMGAEGLVLHIGSHRGRGFEATLPAVAASLEEALDFADSLPDEPDADRDDRNGHGSATRCPILLENAAGAGDTIGRSFEELATVIEATDGDERLGICLDTQHLWASGVSFRTQDEADALIRTIEDTVGLRRLQCLHVNDSKVGFGANRDRHENIGEGTIGEEAFAWLLGHPALQDLPGILEVPGDGGGPRARDLDRVRELRDKGLVSRS
jgi:deoxyribonuclease IV